MFWFEYDGHYCEGVTDRDIEMAFIRENWREYWCRGQVDSQMRQAFREERGECPFGE